MIVIMIHDCVERDFDVLCDMRMMRGDRWIFVLAYFMVNRCPMTVCMFVILIYIFCLFVVRNHIEIYNRKNPQ